MANRMYYGRVQRKVNNTKNHDDEGTELRSAVTVDYLPRKEKLPLRSISFDDSAAN